MSHSPITPSFDGPTRDYSNAWQALTKMLREGRSFSGHENNCCFLNTGGPEFADVSGTTGFDFPDDARGLALVDWDFDGDLDVWLTNQTAPRVRYLRNDGSNRGKFLALKLQGTTCNRDAIGARVEVTCQVPLAASTGQSGRRKLIRTLHAGEGFLSQSSKWLHFGLGNSQNVSQVTIRWPGGDLETFAAVPVDGFYLAVQGSSALKPFVVPPHNDTLKASTVAAAKPIVGARIVVPGRPIMPDVSYISADGGTKSLRAASRRPVLVSLWASWCPPCIEELKSFADHAAQLNAVGVDVLAINIESLDTSSDSKASERVLQQMDFPFATGEATPSLAGALDVVQRAIIDRSRPLGLPSSFLLDSNRRLVVAYLGPLTVQQLLSDVKLLNFDDEQLRDAATAGNGRWATEPYGPSPVHASIARHFIEAGALNASGRYINHAFVRDASLYATLAAAYADNQDWKPAIDWQKKAINVATPAKKSGMLRTLNKYKSMHPKQSP